MARRNLVYMAVAALVGIIGCEAAKEREYKQKLDALVAKGATRADVTQALGERYHLYAKGEASWSALQQFLGREPQSAFSELRQASEQYPRIMYYTTEWRMTWVFLDDRDVIRGYYLTSQ